MDTLIVARVRRPHGVRGAVLVTVETDRPGQVFQSGRKLGVGDRNGTHTARDLTLTSFRPRPDGAMVTFAEINDRDAVATLRDCTLVIDAAEAAPVADDEVHYGDLLGMEVFAAEQRLGKVREIREIVSREFLVIGKGRAEKLVPLIPEFIDRVDVPGGRIVVTLPDGFLEI